MVLPRILACQARGIKCVLFLGSRGGQICLPKLWSLGVAPPAIVINAGCARDNVRPPLNGGKLALISCERDYFSQRDPAVVNAWIQKYSYESNAKSFLLRGEPHMPTLTPDLIQGWINYSVGPAPPSAPAPAPIASAKWKSPMTIEVQQRANRDRSIAQRQASDLFTASHVLVQDPALRPQLMRRKQVRERNAKIRYDNAINWDADEPGWHPALPMQQLPNPMTVYGSSMVPNKKGLNTLSKARINELEAQMHQLDADRERDIARVMDDFERMLRKFGGHLNANPYRRMTEEEKNIITARDYEVAQVNTIHDEILEAFKSVYFPGYRR